MKENHQLEIVVDIQNFSSVSEFISWKKEFEQDSNQRFVQLTGVKECGRVDEISRITFSCHCTGFEKKKGFDQLNKSRNVKGSWKMNGYCIAQMIFIKRLSDYEMIFYRTHNHEIRLRNCNLSEKTIATVAAMMKAQLKDDFILEHFQKKPNSQRDHFLTDADIRNIRTRYGFSNGGREHKDDSKNVHIFVHSHSDKVIYYRPKKVDDDGKKEPFMICIQTDRQREFLSKMDNLFVVCVDSTHDIGPKFKLATLMTVDQNMHGFPLAFCVCKSEDTVSMQIFFAAIREKIGRRLKAEYFVSDDANGFYNAWCAEMCTENDKQHKRLCAWHVNQCWIGNLNRFRDPLDKKKKPDDSATDQQVCSPDDPSIEKKDSTVEQLEPTIQEQPFGQMELVIQQPSVYQELVGKGTANNKEKAIKQPTKREVCKNLLFKMRCALTVEEFDAKKNDFEKMLASDAIYQSFAKYFHKKYTLRYEQWADAYLPSFGPCNTNMYLESWHKTLKHKYLGGKKRRRLDFLLDKIVQYDKDQEKIAEHHKEFGFTDKRTSLVLKYHKEAIANNDDGRYKINRNQNPDVIEQYVVEDGKEVFFVTTTDNDPNHWKDCPFSCEKCKTCFCLFECTCPEYRKKHNSVIICMR